MNPSTAASPHQKVTTATVYPPLLRKPGHAGTLYCTKSATISIAVVLIITISCQIGLVHQFAPFDEAMKLDEVKLSFVNEEVFRQTLVLGLQMASHFFIL